MYQDLISVSGKYVIREADSGIVVAESHNMIHTAGKALIGDMLRDVSGYDTGLTYMGISTNTTAPTVSDVSLAGEVMRKALTSKSRSGNVLTVSAFFTAAESTYAIKKLGTFGHSTAGASLGTGVLFSSSLVDYDNSAGLVDLVIDYVLTIG